LLALNILQTSLDFKPDENLAENLFRLYEFIKNSVLNYKEKIDDLIASIQIVSELYESWCSINAKD
jgi:flagellin-specific chaperone FliS